MHFKVKKPVADYFNGERSLAKLSTKQTQLVTRREGYIEFES